ncbi:hypothetical protein HK104_008569 [Borealophlyctis nickersoniae]|nr:hypothetical protein HK104_008569 [Borealophlyctis nickersoniae]
MCAVLGNYLALNLCYRASSITQFGTQLSCYGLCAVTAVSQCYTFEYRLRSIFIMERVLGATRGVSIDALAKVPTMELLSQIKETSGWGDIGVEYQKDVQDERQDGSGAQKWHMEAEKGVVERGGKGAGPIMRSASIGSEADVRQSRGNGTPNTHSKNSAQGKRFRLVAWAYRVWKKQVYLAWDDSAIEQEYVKWQSESFRILFRITLFVLLISGICDVFLDVST